MNAEDAAEINASRLFAPEAFESLLADWSRTLVDYLKSVPRRPVMQWASPDELSALFAAESCEEGCGPDAVLARFRDLVLPWCQHHYHSRVAGHMVGHSLPIAVVADLAASLLNQGMGIYEVSPGAVTLTQRVIQWLLDAAGFGGASADGIVTTGGSEANLTAVLAARARAFGAEVREEGLRREDRPLILASELTHYSIARAAGMVGIGRRRVESIPVDESYRMRVEALEAAIERALGAGQRIVCVVATAGTTATGTFDPIEAIADICARHELWLHVDGAHGASLLFTETRRRLLAGVERARSLSWDPHKMLFVPSALGTLLVQDGRDLEVVFDEKPNYLFARHTEDEARWNFTRKNFRCTQRFDALRLWAALKFHGRRTIGQLVDQTADLAEYMWARLVDDPLFKPLLKPPFNIVCFRFIPPNFRGDEEDLDALNAAIRTKLLRDGSAWITTTVLGGRTYLRAAIMSPACTTRDMDDLVDLAREAGEGIYERE